MRYSITTILLIGILFSQEGQVTNIVAEQRTDGSHIVDISYDLLPDSEFPSFTVFPYVSTDGGETFELLPVNNEMFPNVLGDNVLPGIGKAFFWDHVDGYESISADNIIFKISAYGHVAATLPGSFEMIEIQSGDFLGYYYSEASVYRGDAEHVDGHDSIMSVDYNFEIMKYPVTNAQFCTFLIELLDEGLISGPASNSSVYYDYSIGSNPYMIPNPPRPEEYDPNIIIYTETQPSQNYRIFWNGETYVVEEGFGNHPVVSAYTYGMELFAEYYALRLPTWYEYMKSFRGMEAYDYIGEHDQSEFTNNEELYYTMNGYFNFNGQGDPWEDYHDSNNSVTTPVNYFDGSLHGDFQTINAVSEYGLYDMQGNVNEIVTIDAACYDAWHECGNESDPENQPINNIGIATSKPYLYQPTDFHDGGGWYSLSGTHSMMHWNTKQVGGSGWTMGFRCARTVTGD